MLTANDVKNAKPESRDRVLWDMTGFGVRVRPSGSKSFLIQYRNADGQSRRVTLGRVDKLSLAEARRLAKQHLADVVKGKDPAVEKRERRKSPTVREIAEEYLATKPLKPKTHREWSRLLKVEILPVLGSHKIRSVTQRQVRLLYHRIGDSGRRVLANRVHTVTSSLLQWAVERDLIDVNPARGIQRVKKGVEKADTRTLSEDEVHRFLRACETLRALGGYPGRIAVAFELMLLCGLRPSDAYRLRWEQIDYDAGLIRFKADDGKTWSDAPAYLRGPAQALLRSLEKTDEEWVFPSRRKRGAPVGDARKIWAKVEELAKFDRDADPKHLRKTHATLARSWGHDLGVVSKAARHSSEQVTSKHYAFVGDDRVKAAEDEIQARIAALANEKAKVRKIR